MLFEGGDEILASFGDRLSGKATRELEKLGVDVRVKTRVTDVTEDDITVTGPDGEASYPCRTKVWAAGVTAAPLARSLADAAGAEVDRAGRIKVLPDCTLPGHPEHLRRRRRDGTRRPTRSGRGSHADRHPCGCVDQAADQWGQ